MGEWISMILISTFCLSIAFISWLLSKEEREDAWAASVWSKYFQSIYFDLKPYYNKTF